MPTLPRGALEAQARRHQREQQRDEIPDRYEIIARDVGRTPMPVAGRAGRDDYNGRGSNSAKAMAKAHVYQRLLTELESAHDLVTHFQKHKNLHKFLGLDEIPDFRTVNRSWREQFNGLTQDNLLRTVETLRENLLDHENAVALAVQRDVKTAEGVNIPERQKDRAYELVEDRLRDLVDYNRSDNSRIPAETLTDFATYLARRNTFPEQGAQRWSVEEARDETEVFSPEAFRQAIRKKGRRWAVTNTAESGAVDPNVDSEDLDWTLRPERDYAAGENWHSLTEEAIEKTVDTLRKEGALTGSVEVCIDGSVRDYNKHGSTESGVPNGVHESSHFDTRYGWEDLSATAKVGDRTIVLANISYTPDNDLFRCVKYLLDRCRELVDVECFYADSEFANTDIMRYIDHLGEDYVFKAREHDPVKDVLDGFHGNAGWVDNYTMNSADKGVSVTTRLFGIESDYKSKDDDDDDENEQLGLGQFQQLEGQTSLDDHADEPEVDYEAFFTNKKIRSEGIKPSENPIAHDTRNTVWGLARQYRRRWSIETAFRQIKYQFLPRTTSRDLGVRRYFWTLALVLYNSWACLNITIQEAVPEWNYSRPPVIGNVFLMEIAQRLRPPPD